MNSNNSNMSNKFLQPSRHLLFLRLHLLYLKEFSNYFWPLLIATLCLLSLYDCPLSDNGLVKQYLLLLISKCAQRTGYLFFIGDLVISFFQLTFIAGDSTTAVWFNRECGRDVNGGGVLKVRTRTQLVCVVESDRGRECLMF